jgi:hypothetical protein
MDWIGALYIFLVLLVCAELYATRKMVERLYDEVSKLNETVKRQVILRMNKELSEDETDKKDLADKTQ